MGAAVELVARESNVRRGAVSCVGGVVCSERVSYEPQLLRAGEGSNLCGKRRPPRWTGVVGHLRNELCCGDEVVPRRVGGQIRKDRNDRFGWCIDEELAAVLHLFSLPPSTLREVYARSTRLDPSDSLAAVDLVRLGARSGLLWRSPDVVLAGLGATHRIDVDLSGNVGEAQTRLSDFLGEDSVDLPGTGPVGFAALSFDAAVSGFATVPELVLGESEGVRFLTALTNDAAKTAVDAVRNVLSRPLVDQPNTVELELDRTAESFRDDVVTVARDTIASSGLEKAVLARALTLTGSSDFEPARIIDRLADRFRSALLFSIDGFLGASPELLVSRRDRTVRAHPLAGTAGRLADTEADAAAVAELLASSKDRVEHGITIEWLLAELLEFSSYVDAEPEPSVVTLENVHHLGTRVEGVLSEPPASVLELVQALHPTPALGGRPQVEALALIDEIEGFDRMRYGGPSGWFDGDGNGQFAVSVRTAQVNGRTARIAAGGGVVAQSDPESELRETQAKFRAMLGSFLP